MSDSLRDDGTMDKVLKNSYLSRVIKYFWHKSITKSIFEKKKQKEMSNNMWKRKYRRT